MLVYYDFNAMIYALNKINGEMKGMYDYFDLGKYQYVFSPAHFEEIAHSDFTGRQYALEDYMTFLGIFTKNMGIRPTSIEKPLQFYHEEPIEVYKRVINNNGGLETTKGAEQYDKTASMYWKKIRSSKKFFDPKKISSVSSDQIFTSNLFFEKIRSFFDYLYGQSLSYDDCHNCYESLQNAPYTDLERTMEALIKILQYIGFHSDKDNKLSGFTHDISHTHYASKCDVFVTDDSSLTYRVQAVYSYMGIPTKIMKFEDYCHTFLDTKK